MLHLLFPVIFLEAALILSLLFKTPVRKLVIVVLDRFKRGQGPIVVKTVAGTVFTVLCSSLYSVGKIQQRWIQDGDVNPTDQVLLSKHLLEASLMGFFLFLALLTDRLHYYIRELRLTRKTVEAAEESQEKFGGPEDLKAREEQVGSFKDFVRQLQSELESKTKEADEAKAQKEAIRKELQSKLESKTKEADEAATRMEDLKRNSDGLLLKYERLVAENQELRGQLVTKINE